MTEKIIEDKHYFTSNAIKDIKTISEKVMEFLQLINEGMYKHENDFMKRAETIENTIDDMREQMRQGHRPRHS